MKRGTIRGDEEGYEEWLRRVSGCYIQLINTGKRLNIRVRTEITTLTRRLRVKDFRFYYTTKRLMG